MTEQSKVFCDLLKNNPSAYQRCVEQFIGTSTTNFKFSGATPNLQESKREPQEFKWQPQVSEGTAHGDPVENYFDLPFPEMDQEFEQPQERDPVSPIEQPQRREEKQHGGVKSVFVPRKEAFGGGQEYRPIYCGMDPANKPKNAVYGTRLACYRKGFYYGTQKGLHG